MGVVPVCARVSGTGVRESAGDVACCYFSRPHVTSVAPFPTSIIITLCTCTQRQSQPRHLRPSLDNTRHDALGNFTTVSNSCHLWCLLPTTMGNRQHNGHYQPSPAEWQPQNLLHNWRSYCLTSPIVMLLSLLQRSSYSHVKRYYI